MRLATFSLILMTLVTASASADVHVKQVVRVDPYYDGGPAGGTTAGIDLWFGGGKIAALGETGRAIYDPARGRLTVVNLADSSYCEIALPVMRDSVLAADYKARLDRWFYDGSVEPTGERKEIGGRSCASYAYEQWIQLGEDKFAESEKTFWLATDVPFDWKPFIDMQLAILSLANSSDSYREGMRALRGFALAAEMITYDRGQQIVSRLAAEVLGESAPPDGCYDVPAYCTKRDRLPRDMFLILVQLVY
jgi:hypothetical protein